MSVDTVHDSDALLLVVPLTCRLPGTLGGVVSDEDAPYT